MTNTYKGHSLASLEHARQLLAKLPQNGSPAYIETLHQGSTITLEARRCIVTRQLTGGLQLEARPGSPAYGGPARVFKRRLPPGWTPEQASRAASRLYHKACIELHRQQYAEQVWRLSEQLKPPVEAVEAEEKQLGKVSDFHSMTVSQAEYWLLWLEQFKPEEPAMSVTPEPAIAPDVEDLRDYLSIRGHLKMTPISRVYAAALQLEQKGEVVIHRSPDPEVRTVIVEQRARCGGVV